MGWRKDGRLVRGGHWFCAVHARKAQGLSHRKHRAEWKVRRRALVASERARRGNACERCGETLALHWHHLDPATKAFSLARAAWYSLRLIRLELAKCDLLCVACHKAAHVRLREVQP
jgi:hypothetical protein